jgi:hypothetical protein
MDNIPRTHITISLPVEKLKSIDSHRGEMNRSEYISYLIPLGESAPAKPEPYRTEAEKKWLERQHYDIADRNALWLGFIHPSLHGRPPTMREAMGITNLSRNQIYGKYMNLIWSEKKVISFDKKYKLLEEGVEDIDFDNDRETTRVAKECFERVRKEEEQEEESEEE